MAPSTLLTALENLDLKASTTTEADEDFRIVRDKDRNKVVLHKFVVTKFAGVSGQFSAEEEERQANEIRAQARRKNRFKFLSSCCRSAED